MQDKQKLDLVSTEVSGLWDTYMNDSLAICTLKHFLNTLHDEEIRHILQRALDISNSHIQVITEKFNQEGLPIPKGFGEDDIDMKAPKLYTDPFYLFYLISTTQMGMNNYTVILNHISRADIRDFFSKCIQEYIELLNLTVDALQQQGLYIKSPRVEILKDIDFIDKQDFFSAGWFGKGRNILAREITGVFANLRLNIISGALATGFSQVAHSKKLSNYLLRGRDLAWKRVKDLSQFLIDEHIPIPSTSDSFVTDSTVAPFSDKLMLYHTLLILQAGLIYEGNSFANSMRHDLQAYFSGSMMETAKFSEDALDILIENKWMEQPPQVIEHRELVNV
ncbi:MAG: DUF3231 family protein [Bacillota bacterium]